MENSGCKYEELLVIDIEPSNSNENKHQNRHLSSDHFCTTHPQ